VVFDVHENVLWVKTIQSKTADLFASSSSSSCVDDRTTSMAQSKEPDRGAWQECCMLHVASLSRPFCVMASDWGNNEESETR